MILCSYGHDTSKSYDLREEIRRGKEAYRAHFGTDPIGYRAPQGNIKPCEFSILEDEGFEFDSSVFPSYLNFRNGHTCYGVSKNDPLAALGVAAQSLSFLADPEKRKAVIGRS